MYNFKVNIYFSIKEIAWGGANQFLKSLKQGFIKEGVYTNSHKDADIILFNSHQHYKEIQKIKKSCPHKLFVHRVDGPTRLYNKMSDGRDEIVYSVNQRIADATVFQSEWSRQKNFEMGLKDDKPSVVILNTADPTLFNKSHKMKTNDKTEIISTSFSKNINKGFGFYQKLDHKLDYKKYNYTFAGNSPIPFLNINNVGPKKSPELAALLKKSDIYITASKNDPCSNSLIEALSCGLTCFALKSGGHPEILENDERFLFSDTSELINKIAALNSKHTPTYSRKSQNTVKEYLDFFNESLE